MKKSIALLIIGLAFCSSAAYATTMSVITTVFKEMPSTTGYVYENGRWVGYGTHYVWRIDPEKLSIPAGQEIKSASLTICYLRNWEDSSLDKLFIDLLNYAPDSTSDKTSGSDIAYPGVVDYFQLVNPDPYNGTLHLATAIGSDYYYSAKTLTINFNQGQLDTLTQFLEDGVFGFGFDAHCHWYDKKIKFEMTTCPAVPEPGTFLLLGAGLVGVGLLRRRIRK